MYGKLFRQMFRGTLASVGPWQALVTFQQFIILADSGGVVDMTADAIARETTIPLEVIRLGIDVLEQPDPESRSPDCEGRRIVRLSDSRAWGWRIVNYEHYRKLRSEEEKREYHRQYWHDKRSPKLKQTQTTQSNSIDSTHAECSKQNAEVKEKKKERSNFVPPTLEQVTQYMTGRNRPDQAQKFYLHYESNGWRVGKNPMKKWEAAAAAWLTRDFDNGGKAAHSVYTGWNEHKDLVIGPPSRQRVYDEAKRSGVNFESQEHFDGYCAEVLRTLRA